MWTDANCGGIFEMGSSLYECNSETRLQDGFTVCDGKKTNCFSIKIYNPCQNSPVFFSKA